jgi:hypothetical protein
METVSEELVMVSEERMTVSKKLVSVCEERY